MNTSRPSACAVCGIEIVGTPTIHVGLPFCCAGCAADGPCSCSYDPEPPDDSRVRYCLDIAGVLAGPVLADDRVEVDAPVDRRVTIVGSVA